MKEHDCAEYIKYSNIDPEWTIRLDKADDGKTYPAILGLGSVPILFCPWCGEKISDLTEDEVDKYYASDGL